MATALYMQQQGLTLQLCLQVFDISQDLADCMMRDKFVNVGIEAFASLGCHGQYASNAERDFHRWTHHLHGVEIDPYDLWVNVQLPDRQELTEIAVPCILAFEVINTIAKAGELQSNMSLLGPDGLDGPRKFWAAAQEEPWGMKHPALEGHSARDLRNVIPIWFHIDGAEIYNNSEFVIWSWCSAVAEALNIWDYKFLYCLIPSMVMHVKSVFKQINDAVTELIGWDLGICEIGYGPELGFYQEEFPANSSRSRLKGQALAFRAAFAGLKTDGKARRETHEFVRHYGCTFLCESCFATQTFAKAPPITNYKNFNKAAPWRWTCFGHETYESLDEPLSPWVKYVRGARIELFFHDIMHVVYLGFARDLIASVLIVLCESEQPADKDVYLKQVHMEMNQWLKTHRQQKVTRVFSRVSIGRVAKDDYPELSSCYKAAAIKQMVFYFAHRMSSLCNANMLLQLSATCLWSLAEYIHRLDVAPLILSHEERQDAIVLGKLHLLTYQKLAERSVHDASFLFKIRPKHHTFDHMLEFMSKSRINPGKFTCFRDEDFLGHVKRLGQQCHGKTISKRALQRYILTLALRFHRRQRCQRYLI